MRKHPSPSHGRTHTGAASAMARHATLAGCVLSVGTACCQAQCVASLSAPTIDMGRVVHSALADADIPGYRLFSSPRRLSVTVECPVARTTLRWRVTRIASTREQLLRWDTAQAVGALRMRLLGAAADGTAVPIRTEDGEAGVPDAVREGGVFAFDLRNLAQGARVFVLEFEWTGLIEAGFAPSSAVTLTLHPRIEFLD